MSFALQLDREVPGLLAHHHLPGAAVALIEGCENVAVKVWGQADSTAGRAVNRNTLFNVASISKSVTSWGVMKLVEQDRVRLDDPVEPYLGGWRLPLAEFDPDEVTLRRLLSHTAGIETAGIKAVAADAPPYSTLDVLEGRLPPLDERQRRYCRDWGTDPERDRDPVSIRFEPGSGFHYSNLGFTLLQLLIEAQSGTTFADFMQAEVLAPLGMATARFAPPAPSDLSVATAYAADGSTLPPYRHVALAAGGLYCSIEDLARFACAELRAGQGVISNESIATLFERQCHAESIDGLDFDAALGHFRLELGEQTVVHHTGGVPGWRSVYGVIPQSGRGFCALINSDGGNPFWMELIKAWAESW